MAQHGEDRTIDVALELLKTNGFDGLAEAVTVLLNSAMVSERRESSEGGRTGRFISKRLSVSVELII